MLGHLQMFERSNKLFFRSVLFPETRTNSRFLKISNNEVLYVYNLRDIGAFDSQVLVKKLLFCIHFTNL